MAAIKINFDANHNPIVPTFILGDRMGNKFGIISNVANINVSDKMNDCPEISFTVYKYNNGEQCYLWDKLQNLMTVYCPEWNTWFELGMDLSDETDILKNIILTRITEAELSQLYLYEFEANTDDDIDLREIGKTTILYNKNDKSCSLLDRTIRDKAPHYSIAHVDESIAGEQREFSFDKTTIRDAFNEIAEELNCLFIYGTSDEDGNLKRTISVYDLENYCKDCGNRGEFTDKCSKCGSTNIKPGYGKDTNIFVTSDGLGNSVKLEVEKDSIKNCFRLEAGDEDMTDAVKICNPNGSLYLWSFSDYMKSLMPKELKYELEKYNDIYYKYNNKQGFSLNKEIRIDYNKIVDCYNNLIKENSNNPDVELRHKRIEDPVIGYPNLIDDYYNVIDMKYYLESELMPTIELSGTSTEEQIKLLENMSKEIQVEDLSSTTSVVTVDYAVLSTAKVIIDGRYQVEIDDGSTYNESTHKWKGKFIVTNLSDEEDTLTSSEITITLKDDKYEVFIKNQIDRMLNEDEYNPSIIALFDLDTSLNDFKNELTKYGLASLESFMKSCTACIDLMAKQEINRDKDPGTYDELVAVYKERKLYIDEELKKRESEIEIVLNALINFEKILDGVQKTLDIKTFLGDLYPVLCSYIREDEYSNSNYISDGLSNAEIVKKAKEFVEKAEKELYKASHLQHKISADIKNLLTIKEFEPLVKQFECGNWIRVRADEEIFKLRLLEYDINYDDHTLNVTFSDVSKVMDGISDLKSIIDQASSMAGSFNSVKTQMDNATKKTKYVDNWVSEGIDITKVSLSSNAYNQDISWDKNGLLCREIDLLTGEYKPQQLKVITNGLYLTEDNWTTSKTGIGKFNFYNPLTQKNETRYGVVADAIVSNLVLSEKMGIYNKDNNIILNNDGFTVMNGEVVVNINPNNEYVFSIKNKNDYVFGMTTSGNLEITGEITASKLTLLDNVTIDSKKVEGLKTIATSGKYSDLDGAPDLSQYLTSADMSVYISKDGVVGKTPSEGATGFKVSSSGLLEASNAIIYGSVISGNVIASTGKIGGFTISGPKTATNGFWNWALSSIINTSSTVDSSNPQYAVFMRGQSDDGKSGAITPDNVVFGVKKRTATSTTWNDASYMFYVKANGMVKCTDITTTGDVIIYDRLYMLNNGGEKCEVLSLRNDGYQSLTIGSGCDGLYFKSKNKTLGEVHNSSNIEWIFYGDITGKANVRVDGFVEGLKGGIFNADVEVAGAVESWNVKSQEYSLTDPYNNITKSAIRYVSGSSDGMGINIGAGGLVVIGAGESANNFINEEGKEGQNEQLCLTSDTSIYLATKCNTIAERIQLVFTNTGIFRPTETGKWAIGSGSYRFSNGYFNNVYNSSGAITGSDKRIKKDFSDLPNPEDFIMSLKPMQYKYIDGDSDRYHWGFIAQDVKYSLDNICKSDCGIYIESVIDNENNQKPLSECTYEEKELALRYEELIAPHIYVTQIHNERIKQLEDEIKTLKEKIELLIA